MEIKFDRLDLDARRYDTTQFFRPYGRDFGFLHIVNIQVYDAGRYTCEAQTPLSRDRATAYVLVAGPPGPCAGEVLSVCPLLILTISSTTVIVLIYLQNLESCIH